MNYRTEIKPLIPDVDGLICTVGDMNIYAGLEALPAPIACSSVTIGTFDGVHRGHQALIRRTVDDAHAHGRAAVVLTFDRHPKELTRPESAPPRLTTPAQRNALIAELGVDVLIVVCFDHALAALSPDAFMVEILKGRLGARSILVGQDFCFGKGRAGDLAYLQWRQRDYDFTLHSLGFVQVDGVCASSTGVRERLLAGEIAAAEAMLGHSFWLIGRGVYGQRHGRACGFSTAKLALLYRQITPAGGAYAMRVRLDDSREWEGICIIGEEVGSGIDVCLFDCAEDLYGQDMALCFVRRLCTEEISIWSQKTALHRTIDTRTI
ncbi:MAG: adenylyltransferase/riboflavin kinase [Chthonomonadaceae bacterium]|nr:adenylyltransferase/riboflavin kinase [Chthonomonadaceae bacterium]